MASDGRWYPPEQRPDAQSPTPAPPTAFPASMPSPGGPVAGDAPGEEVIVVLFRIEANTRNQR